MKKILFFAATLFAAVTMSAQDPIPVTCAEAVAAMPAQSGSETEDVYIVTGYITNTYGSISPSRTDPTIDQQTFYMDDEKGTKKTLQGYWCNLPGHEALNVGDKITVTGKIVNYNNTPEIKNGDVAIIERATTKIDTLEVDVCEALEEGEALEPGDYTPDVFIVYGRLKGTDAVNNYGQHTFEMACGEKIFKPYNCKGEDGLELGKGDSVAVTGKLYNYNGTIEISNGKVELIEKSKEEEVIQEVTVAEAIAIAMALEKKASTNDRYAITGYVSEIAIAYNETYGNISFFMVDDVNSEAKDFEAYRVKVSKEDSERVVPGAKVKVTAALKRYYSEAGEDPEKNPEIDLAETVDGGTIEFLEETAVETITNNVKSIKRIEDGQIIIYRNGVRYNALGTEIR